MNKTFPLYLLSFLILLAACKTGRQTTQQPQQTAYSQTPAPLIVYKTRYNYVNLVPIVLSQNKDSILHYPHPQDLKYGNSFRYPVLLEQGYLLDKKGIQPGTAFLRLTYEEYAAFKDLPSQHQLLQMIADTNPFIELYRCKISLDESQRIDTLNAWIRNGQLGQKCSKLK